MISAAATAQKQRVEKTGSARADWSAFFFLLKTSRLGGLVHCSNYDIVLKFH